VRSAGLWCKRFVRDGGFENDETDARLGDLMVVMAIVLGPLSSPGARAQSGGIAEKSRMPRNFRDTSIFTGTRRPGSYGWR